MGKPGRPSKGKRQQLNVRITPALRDALLEQAAADGVAVQDFVTAALLAALPTQARKRATAIPTPPRALPGIEL